MSATMLQPENLTEKNTAGTLELADFPLQKGSVELLKQKWESATATRPGVMLQRSPTPQSLVPGKISCTSAMEKVSAESRRTDVFKEESLDVPQQIEHFPITVEELRSHFEALGGKKETESERSSPSAALKSHPGSHSVNSPKEFSVKRGRAIFEKMSSENGHRKSSEVGSRKPVRGLSTESTPMASNTRQDSQETVSLKERLALYKAAVSDRASSNSFTHTSEKHKFCTVPGGLAAVRKQFEKVRMISLQKTFPRYQHKPVQETSSSSQYTVSSNTREDKCNEMTSKESKMETSQTQEVFHHEQVTNEIKMASTFTQHTDETVINAAQNEELPKTVTKILKEQIERTAQEKAVHSDREPARSAKEVKMESMYQETTLPSTVSLSITSASKLQENSTPRKKQDGTANSVITCSRSHEYGSTEKFSTTHATAPLEMTVTCQYTDSSSSPTYHDEEQIPDETHIQEVSHSTVKMLRHMLEEQNLGKLGQLYPVDLLNSLQQRSELKELKRSVKISINHFESQPLTVTRDNFSQRFKNEAVYTEDTEKRHITMSHRTFEMQPLPVTNEDVLVIQMVHGTSVEENISHAGHKVKQSVETQPQHMEDSEELSTAETSSQKSNRQDQGPTQDAAASVTPQQSKL